MLSEYLKCSQMPVQASSNRKIELGDRDGLEELAKDALQDALTFASVCMIGRPASELEKQLREWWAEAGSQLLLGKSAAAVDTAEARSSHFPFFHNQNIPKKTQHYNIL